MKTLVNVLLLVLAAAGAVWMLQGVNWLGGSFMSGRPEWLYIGAVTTIVSMAALWLYNRRRLRPPGAAGRRSAGHSP